MSETELRTPTLKLGDIELESPVLQAALSGYSDWPMRVIARRMGASYTICEVMLDQFILSLRNRERTRHFMKITAEEFPVGGQLMGAEPEHFPTAALKLVEAGFHVIDINFGCPVKKVLGRCRGGFHLSQPEVALDIIHRVRDAVPTDIPVTVKMRRGIDDTNESRDNFFKILDGAFDAGLASATVHGRTVIQRYNGPSSWDSLRAIKQHVGDKVIIGSGDLFTPQDCLRMMQETGVDGVSLARGAIGNPWIFNQVHALLAGESLAPGPSMEEQRGVITEHFALALETYGDRRACSQMRKFGVQYSTMHPNHEDVRDAFMRVREPQEWYDVLDAWY